MNTRPTTEQVAQAFTEAQRGTAWGTLTPQAQANAVAGAVAVLDLFPPHPAQDPQTRDMRELEAAVGHDAAVALIEGLGATIERPEYVSLDCRDGVHRPACEGCGCWCHS